MSELDENTPDGGEVEPRLRRRLLGYKRADVEQVLELRDGEVENLEGELDERDAELRELRQDVAALWLAFAQHDRMIKGLGDAQAAAPAASAPPAPAMQRPEPGTAPEMTPGAAPEPAAEARPVAESQPFAEVAEAEPSVGRQLADLDEVLAAIEMATQTLEQTYVEEIGDPEVEAANSADPEGKPSGQD